MSLLIFWFLSESIRIRFASTQLKNSFAFSVAIQNRHFTLATFLFFKYSKKYWITCLVKKLLFTIQNYLILLDRLFSSTPDFDISDCKFLCSTHLEVIFVCCTSFWGFTNAIFAVYPQPPVVMLSPKTLMRQYIIESKWIKHGTNKFSYHSIWHRLLV